MMNFWIHPRKYLSNSCLSMGMARPDVSYEQCLRIINRGQPTTPSFGVRFTFLRGEIPDVIPLLNVRVPQKLGNLGGGGVKRLSASQEELCFLTTKLRELC
jgi:hypothetical protein